MSIKPQFVLKMVKYHSYINVAINLAPRGIKKKVKITSSLASISQYC